jgi:hypothetical protein
VPDFGDLGQGLTELHPSSPFVNPADKDEKSRPLASLFRSNPRASLYTVKLDHRIVKAVGWDV